MILKLPINMVVKYSFCLPALKFCKVDMIMIKSELYKTLTWQVMIMVNHSYVLSTNHGKVLDANIVI